MAAEQIVLGEMTTGAESEIERATKLARKMVMEYGMSDKLGPLQFGHKEEMVFLGRDVGEQRNYSDAVAEEIDQEVRRLITQAYAKDILERPAIRSRRSRCAWSRRRRWTAPRSTPCSASRRWSRSRASPPRASPRCT